ncbi:MAG: hypothetical protein U0451_03185 [Candidatus Saccharimonadales bacterium]
MINPNLQNLQATGELEPDLQRYMANQGNQYPEDVTQRFDEIVSNSLNPDQKKQVDQYAHRDLDMQVGANGQILDSQGEKFDRSNEGREHFAEEIVSLETKQGDESRVRSIARRMKDVTTKVLSQQGIELSDDVGLGNEASEIALIADNTSRFNDSGLAAELNPMSYKQIDLMTQQDVGLKAVKAIDKDPSKLSELAKTNKDLALDIAKTISVLRQNGTLNRSTTERLGDRILRNNKAN